MLSLQSSFSQDTVHMLYAVHFMLLDNGSKYLNPLTREPTSLRPLDSRGRLLSLSGFPSLCFHILSKFLSSFAFFPWTIIPLPRFRPDLKGSLNVQTEIVVRNKYYTVSSFLDAFSAEKHPTWLL